MSSVLQQAQASGDPCDVLPTSKVCPRCRTDKPRVAFGIRRDRNTLAPRCRECEAARAKARYRPHPRIVPTHKACTGCGDVLAFEEFPTKDGGKRRRSVCRDCKNRRNAEYKAANRQKVKAGDAAYREARRSELTDRQRAWREAHPERYLAIHSGWKKRNPDAVRAMGNKRRVLVEQAGPHYTAAEWKALKAAYDYRCLMCKRREPEIRLTVDHIVPISLGGANTIDSVQPLCRSCNSKKHRGILDLRPLSQVALL
jgi:5-methylcytosine-specific restriction endonuclease McrA